MNPVAGPFHVHLATVVEFIHTATLLHDDVVDFGDAKLVVGALNALTIQLWCTAPTIARTPDLHLGFRLNTWDACRLLSFFTIILLWLRDSF